MENKLSRLFDFQKFEKNNALEALIAESENRYARELSDDDLEFVNAAGEMTSPMIPTDPNSRKKD